MKHKALFSSKDKSKKLKCRLLQILFGALRVKSETVTIKHKCKSDTFCLMFLHIVFLRPWLLRWYSKGRGAGRSFFGIRLAHFELSLKLLCLADYISKFGSERDVLCLPRHSRHTFASGF